MARTFMRYLADGAPRWAEKFGESFVPLMNGPDSTGALITLLRTHDVRLDRTVAPLDAATVDILSPITRNQQFVAQASNYAGHVREVGGDPDAITANVFFGKAPSSLTGARSPIRKPARVKLLDYEVELGLVIGRDIAGPVAVKRDAILDFVAALVIVNDVSARDIQVPEGQFFKGKSFRSFSPAGPFLVVLQPGDEPKLAELELTLWVNDERRQHASVADMIFKPDATLQELSEIMDLHPGDLVITGTPGGVALRPPGSVVQAIAGLLPPKIRFGLFIKGQMKRTEYLQPGDLVRATIRHPDGSIDLGEQSNRVEAA